MFDGCLLPLVVPCLLLCGLDAGTAGGAELEMVIPERVPLEKIHLLQPGGDRGGPRRRRAAAEPEEEEEAVLLRLPAAGAELYLHLRRDLRFLARGFAVERRRGEARPPPPERLCFYSGHALNRSDSFASLSTCAGLVLPPHPALLLRAGAAIPPRSPQGWCCPLPSSVPVLPAR
ncbi:hypothetical protein DV515_00006465 [Chloebia gouldiae]|uniref:Peptidase M12B propeptide domain-containing protein n=1 Tax=Chloebia gouldiae TaxID=44316 RepID=A0A3L8SK80_CHLGU|nr:hypothetical protein DV515_00006465 [Chloebia gouldiae]